MNFSPVGVKIEYVFLCLLWLDLDGVAEAVTDG
jgi:hypothetical protein